MKCASLLGDASLYVYGELGPEEEERLEQHMEECEACRGEVEHLRTIGRALDHHPADEAGFIPMGVVSGIRSVSPGPSGDVQIALDETTSRLITGSPKRPDIQQLLLSAARNQVNPGLRVESIEILKDHSDS